MRSAWLGFVPLVLVSCGGTPSSTTPSRPPPRDPPGAAPVLLGRPIWDGPMTDPMSLRAVDRARAALADPSPALEGADPRMWLGPLQGWIERRVKLTREVRADADALATDPDPRMQLLASVVLGVTADDFISDLLSVEPPAEFLGEHANETKAVFRETLESQAAPLAGTARTALQKCVATAPTAPPPLRVWETLCRERDAALGELETRVAARNAAPKPTPRPKPPALFADCTTTEVRQSDPDAPPPQLSVKPVVAYLYRGTDVTGDDVARLEQAVAAKLGLDVGMPVVDGPELAAARKLVAQKKLHARGPVCGQAPPLPAVVAHKRRHLIVGEIQTTCISTSTTERCGLLVQYVRAGSHDTAGLPRPMFAKVTSRDVSAAEWIATADRLVADEGAASILGSLASGASSPMFFEVANYADDEPWLRIASTLEHDTQQRIAACVDAAASFDATFTISPTGRTQKAKLAPVTAAPPGSKLASCVTKALEDTAWPCTLDGKPANVAVRMCVAPQPRPNGP